MHPKDRLKQLLLTLSYEQKEVTLASGRRSSFYFDGKQTSLHPEGAYLLGNQFFDILQKHYPEVEAVGGPTLGADPLVTAISMTSFEKGRGLPAFIIRKEPKGHGTQRWIEGAKNLRRGMQVAILEDVITTGGSVLKAIEHAEEGGVVVRVVMVIVDREEGGREMLVQKGYPVEALFTKKELGAA